MSQKEIGTKTPPKKKKLFGLISADLDDDFNDVSVLLESYKGNSPTKLRIHTCVMSFLFFSCSIIFSCILL